MLQSRFRKAFLSDRTELRNENRGWHIYNPCVGGGYLQNPIKYSSGHFDLSLPECIR